MMAYFWWGQKKDEHKICWFSWVKMCVHKQARGIGFKDLRTFNAALLAKESGRIMQAPTTLLHQVFKAKYFPKVSFLDSKLGYNPSFVWEGIWETKKYLVIGCKCRVGLGQSIKVWKENWVPGHPNLAYHVNSIETCDEDTTVDSLIEKVRTLLGC